MATTSPARLIGFRDPEDHARTREVFRAAGFDEEAVLSIVGGTHAAVPGPREAPLALVRSSRGTPPETLTRLFVIGEVVEEAAVREALSPMDLETFLDAGLVEFRDDRLWAPVRLLPHEKRFGLWLAYDAGVYRQAPEYVMGIAPATFGLSRVTIRRPFESMLDVGTGCGVHGLDAASHCRRVVVTDYNSRAVRFARFNAGLNGLENVEAREGDLFEPVSGETFDLVVSNPPFVITPGSEHIYRDGGMAGDEFCRRLVREVPDVLADGGFCQILCNWAHAPDGSWEGRLQEWFTGTGLDVWAMRSDTSTAAEYAATWIRDTETTEPRRFAELFDEWTAYYERLDIPAMSLGIITMRKRGGGSNWFKAETTPDLLGECGADIEAGFALRDFLEAVPDEAPFLATRFRVAPTVRLRQDLRAAGGSWDVEKMEIRRTSGLGYRVRVDPYVVGLLSRCEGERSLGDLIDELAGMVGEGAETWKARLLPVFRTLVEQGFALPETAGTAAGDGSA